MRKAFLAAYRKVFGQVPPVGEIEIINIRVAVTAPVARGELKVASGKRGDVKRAEGQAQSVGGRARTL